MSQSARPFPAMAYINENYNKLKAGYLFPEIARRVKAFTEENPEAAKRLIRCGIGDVTEALPEAVRAAMHKAVDEMGDRSTFRGYGPEQGYDFLRNAIAEHDFKARGIQIEADETPAISWTSSVMVTKSPSPTLCIPSMWTQTSWPATQARHTSQVLIQGFTTSNARPKMDLCLMFPQTESTWPIFAIPTTRPVPSPHAHS
jgi:hypothetical protein